MKAKILELLRSTDGFVSGQELCNIFGVSRTAVWKAVKSLRAAGYEIDAVPNKGYRLQTAADVMYKPELQSLLQTTWVGQEIHYFDTTDSTNNKAKELADKGSPNGTVVVADRQEAGKGRRGRSWESPANVGIFMTILLKPEIDPNHASMLTLVAALSVAEGIREVTEADVGIKWPNDIVLNGKKICGILTEMDAQFDYINSIVIGIGINVHNETFPEEIAHIASSLQMECGKRFHRAAIIAKILEYFEKYYEIFIQTEDLSELLTGYNRLLVNRGAEVRILDPKAPFEGRAVGITRKGELIVDTWEARRLVSSGEVSVRGIYGYV